MTTSSPLNDNGHCGNQNGGSENRANENRAGRLPLAVLRYGSTAPLPEARTLRAGPLTLQFEGGDIRYVRLGRHEILRRVYVAVRDHNWNTIPGRLQDLQIETDEQSFSITFTMIHHQGDVHFTWEGEIRGRPSGEITYAMNGQVLSGFRRNRIGICVLHPASCAGAPCRVEHVATGQDEEHVATGQDEEHVATGQDEEHVATGQDAAGDDAATTIPATESCFPQEISPHQPFMDMRAITHQVAASDELSGDASPIEAEVRFAGDTFEMEDQRNWTDASFKTYSTPLSIPYPVQVNPGDLVQQSITITVSGPDEEIERLAATTASADSPTAPQPVNLTLGAPGHRVLPHIGLGMAHHGEELNTTEISRLRALNPSHLRVDIYPQSRAFVGELRDAWRAAAYLGARLEAALFLGEQGDASEETVRTQLGYVARAVGEFNPDISHWLIFHRDEPSTTSRWVEVARDVLGMITPDARFVVGTNAYFTELNRGRPPLANADGVAYSINPQVHAFDILSMVETLETQATTVASALAFAENLPVLVTPVTLRPRFNPNATGPEPEPLPGEVPSAVDPRQMSLFGAAWTLGSVKYLSQAGAAGITYYETTGWRGILERAGGSPADSPFRSLPASVFPLYHVLADVGEFINAAVIPVDTGNNLIADGLALRAADGRTRVLVANLTADKQQVRLHNLPGTEANVRYLDEQTALTAMQEPEQYRMDPGAQVSIDAGSLTLDLLPFATVRLDLARVQ